MSRYVKFSFKSDKYIARVHFICTLVTRANNEVKIVI
jgi:hypothetical protein